MAQSFGKSLLSLAAACLVQGAALAQDDLSEAFRLLRTNQSQEALSKFREILASDPDNETAFEWAQKIDADNWAAALAEGGEIRKIAQSILTRAKVARAEMSRDESSIDELVQKTMDADYGTRRDAIAELSATHGEFAVPAYVAILGSDDAAEQQDYAISALYYMGRQAVQPLLAALNSDNETQRRNVAAALSLINDDRAAPAFLALANGDESSGIREIAQRALARMGVTGSAADAYAAEARGYLTAGSVRDGEFSSVVWSWNDGALVPSDVPGPLYHLELGKRAALEACKIAPQHDDAKALLARGYLSQVAVIEESLAVNPDDELLSGMGDSVGRLHMVAQSMGVDTLRNALTGAIADNQSAVAVRAIRSLAAAEDRRSLASSPLVGALDASDSRVAYAAALALEGASSGVNMPAADKVVAVLGRAVREEAIRQILFIDGNPVRRQVAQASGSMRGVAIQDASSGMAGVSQFLSFPNYDAVVVAEVLPNGLPSDVIALIRQQSDSTKIVLLAESDEAEDLYGDKVDSILTLEDGNLSQEQLLEKVNEVVGDLDSTRSRAGDVAVSAGEALVRLGRADVNLSGALGDLIEQLDRDASVAIPAATALGEGGSLEHAAKLAEMVSGSDDSDLAVACAHAIGGILSRADAVPTALYESLVAVAKDDAKDMPVRAAAVTALGKGKLAPGERVQLADALSMIASSGN